MNKKILDISEAFFGTKRFLPVYCAQSYQYPISLKFIFKNMKYYFPIFSKEGIPLSVRQNFRVINPSGVATFGLACFESFVETGKRKHRDLFLRQANWLLQQKNGRFPYLFPLGGAKPPWISCLSQGLGISVLLRAYWLENNEIYLKQAFKASNVLIYENKNSPLVSNQSNKSFLEEVPLKCPTHILNGFLSALIGLGELSNAHKTSQGTRNLAFWLKILEEKLLEYQGRFRWSLYEIHPKGKNYSTTGYHSLHVSQLKALHKISPSLLFEKNIHLWESGLNSIFSRVFALYRKSCFRLKN